MVLSARGMRASTRPRRRERGNRSRQAAAQQGRKARAAEAEDFDAEAEIERINGIIAKIDAALALPDLFKRDPKQAAQLSQGARRAASALQRAEEAWLAASSQYDETAG